MGGLLAQRAAVTPAAVREPCTLVEEMCVVAALRGGEEEDAAAALSRFDLERVDERAADSRASV
jgi:hypothetical protein